MLMCIGVLVGGRLGCLWRGIDRIVLLGESQFKTAQAIPIFGINKIGILTRMLISTAVAQQQQRSVLILHAWLLLISGNWLPWSAGTQAAYGNSIRARQSGNSKQQHGVCLVRAARRPGEGKLEALKAVISVGVRRPRYARRGTSCLHDDFAGCLCLSVLLCCVMCGMPV